MDKKIEVGPKAARRLREACGLSQTEAARLLGVPAAEVQRWERPADRPPVTRSAVHSLVYMAIRKGVLDPADVKREDWSLAEWIAELER